MLSQRWPTLRAPAGVVGIIALLCAFSLAAGRWTGAVPQNDDWSYAKSALLLHHTGALHLQGWGEMFLLGQLYTAQPYLWVLGDHVWALNLYGATMAGLWLWCAFCVARRCVGPWRALALVAALAVWPGLGLLVGSFMTDLPAAAMSLLSLLLGIRAVEQQSRGWFGLSLVAGLWAFTIREQLVMCLAAVLIAVLLNPVLSHRLKVEAILAMTGTAAVCIEFEHVRHRLPHADVAPFGVEKLNLSHAAHWLLPAPFTVGIELLPLVAWAAFTLRGRAWLQTGRLLGLLAGVLLAFGLGGFDLARTPKTILSNYFTESGGFMVSLVGRAPHIFGGQLWHVVELLAAVCGVVLLGEIGAWLERAIRDRGDLRSASPAATALAAYTGILTLFTVGICIAGQRQVDRYLLALLPGLGVLLLSLHNDRPAVSPSRRRTALALVTGAGLFLATLSVRTVTATDELDHDVWSAAQHLVVQGVPGDEINAGLAWDGLHARSPVDRQHVTPDNYRGQTWIGAFPGSRDCFVVSVSPLRHFWLVPVGHGDDTWSYADTRSC